MSFGTGLLREFDDARERAERPVSKETFTGLLSEVVDTIGILQKEVVELWEMMDFVTDRIVKLESESKQQRGEEEGK